MRYLPALATAVAIAFAPNTQAGTVTDVTGAQSVTLNTGDTLTINFDLSQFVAQQAIYGGGSPTQIYFGLYTPPSSALSSISLSANLASSGLPAGLNVTPVVQSASLSTNGSTYPVGYALTFIPLTTANVGALFGASLSNTAEIVVTDLGGAVTFGDPPVLNGLDGQAIFVAAQNSSFSTGFAPTSLEVTAVPLPAPLWLLGSGVLAVFSFTRRRMNV